MLYNFDLYDTQGEHGDGIGVFGFISFSKITPRRGYKLDKLPCLTSVFPGDTSDSRISNLSRTAQSR